MVSGMEMLLVVFLSQQAENAFNRLVWLVASDALYMSLDSIVSPKIAVWANSVPTVSGLLHPIES